VVFPISFDKDSVHTGQDWKIVIEQTLLRPACQSARYQDHWAPIFPRHGCARAREENREYFEVRFRAENMVCHINLPKAKRPTERGGRSKGAESGRGFKWRHRRAALGRSRLSRRRRSCPERGPWARNESVVSQTRHRSDFKRSWLRLSWLLVWGEPTALI
jgi:hypothetical protein